jgi:hypothetical protein
MPVLEKSFQLLPGKPAAKKFAEPAEWQVIVDAVFQPAGIWAIRDELVGMFPAAKRPADHYVAELVAGLVIAMLELPANRERSQPNSQRSARAVFQIGRGLDDF